ncbi:hypothetical protein [Sansalvadorimonas verongulae]|uniref:hypothetical protein n=1 Tax=Sansalvadorimonas verongulae TaxID=2172824 RepID=UPI0012BCBC91|nr:hypothetical protein [Sansalvadorimonas verongulae]MTI13382.1 hypothetical protein [Sansalvadorimonas verongulae]
MQVRGFFAVAVFLFSLHTIPATGQTVDVLEAQARWWQYGWMAVHGASALIDSHEAGRTHDKALKRARAVSAFSSGLGVAELLVEPLYPLPAAAHDPDLSDEAFHLKALAERVEEKASWRGHLGGWLTGLISGLVIAGGHGKSSDGWEFFALSGLVTEIKIWTLPKEAIEEWENYQRTGKASGGSVYDERIVSLKPAGARVIPHGLELLWWF